MVVVGDRRPWFEFIVESMKSSSAVQLLQRNVVFTYLLLLPFTPLHSEPILVHKIELLPTPYAHHINHTPFSCTLSVAGQSDITFILAVFVFKPLTT